MKWLVCGGRHFGIDGRFGRERRFIFFMLDLIAGEFCPGYPSEQKQLPEGIELIAGGATGADTVAVDWAIVNWLPFKEYPADWDTYGMYAGLQRNKQMLEEGKPDLVIAFPGGRGTAHMVKIAREAGVRVIECIFPR